MEVHMMKYMAIKFGMVRHKRLALFLHKCTSEHGKETKIDADYC